MPRLSIDAATPTRVMLDGREVLAFGGCNYLGLAHEPRILDAVRAGLERFGLTTTASRETTGNTTIHEQLESRLAAFTGHEACILATEGYTANFMATQALVREHPIALIDAQCHRSIRHACIAAGMQTFDYEHLNPDSAAWLIRQHADTGVLIMTDSVFAADGAVAPLEELLRVLPPRRARLVLDDCHGFCVLGPRGEGTPAHLGVDDPRLVVTLTMAKGLGCYGGAVLGPTDLVDQVRARAWVYRGSTPVPPACALAAITAIDILEESTQRLDRLRQNITTLRASFERLGLALPPRDIPIFSFFLHDAGAMQTIHQRLLDGGILAPLIDYPGGPAPWYFRVVVNAEHTPRDLATLEQALAAHLDAVSPVGR